MISRWPQARQHLLRFAHRFESTLSAHPVRWSFVLVAVHAVIFFAFLTPTFRTNDDVSMMWFANGTLYGEPSPDLIFQHPMVGTVLAGLYRITTAVNWYSLWLYLLHATIFGVILYLVLSDRRGHLWSRLIGLIGFWSVFTLWIWLHLQFTHVSILLGAVGVLLYLSVAARPRSPNGLIVLAGTLVALSAFVRWHGFAGVAILSLPLLARTVRRISWHRQAVFFGSITALLLVGAIFQTAHYAGDEAWQEYLEFNSARRPLSSLDRSELAAGNTELLAELGWSSNDMRMLFDWFFIDEAIYTTEALLTIDAATPLPDRPWTEFLELRHGRLRFGRLLLLGGLLATALSITRWSGRVLLVGTTLWFIAVVAALAKYVRLPNRVSLSVLAFLGLIYLLRPHSIFPGPDGAQQRSMRVDARGVFLSWGGVLLAILIAVSGWAVRIGGADARATTRFAERSQLEFDARMQELDTLDSNGVFVNWGATLGRAQMSPTVAEAFVPDWIQLGWPARSPAQRARMTELGIDDIYTAIANDSHVLLPLKADGNVLAMARANRFSTYYKEHYGFEGRLRPVASVDHGRYLVFDLLVDFELETEGLSEVHADGSRYLYRFKDSVATGSFWISNDGTGINGWATSLDSPGPVDLIVVLDDQTGMLLALAIPSAIDDGTYDSTAAVPPGTPVGFSEAVPDPEAVRIFVVTSRGAYELRRAS